MTDPNRKAKPAATTNRWIAALLLASGAGAWILTFRFSVQMSAHPAAFVGVWTLMMLAMMTPSVLPTVLVFAGAASPGQASTPARTGLFVSGYFLSWAAAGSLVALGQRHLWPLAAPWARPIAAGTLVFAGVYQATSWKQRCLTHCRTPLHFLLQHWRTGPGGALLMGAHHGLYCIGCCVGLMAALIALGMMSPLWMVSIAVVILLEKVIPQGRRLAVPFGVIMVGLGVAIALGGIPTAVPLRR